MGSDICSYQIIIDRGVHPKLRSLNVRKTHIMVHLFALSRWPEMVYSSCPAYANAETRLCAAIREILLFFDIILNGFFSCCL